MTNTSFLNVTEQKYTLSSIHSINNSKYINICHNYYHLFNDYLPYIASFNFHTHSTAPTESVIEHQKEVTLMTSQRELMPLAVRYIDKCNNYYVERPPFKINVSYKNCRAADHTKEVIEDLQIWIPWSIMVINGSFSYNFNPSDVKILFSHKPLEKNTDIYLNPFLPNSYTDGRICWSNSFNSVSSLNEDKNEIKPFDLTYWHSLILNDYMMGGWNADLQSRSLQFLDSIPSYISYGDYMDRQYFSHNYNILDKYVYMSDYKDIAEQVYYICLNKFKMTSKRSKSIAYLKQGKQKDGDVFVRFFAYMSLLSLEDTLAFYKQVAQVAVKIHYQNSSSSYSYIYQKFSTFSKEFIEDTESNYYSDNDFIPISLSLNKYLTSQKAMDNGDYLASSTAGKNVYVQCYIDNLNEDQQSYLHSLYTSNIIQDLSYLKISPVTLTAFLNDISNSTETKAYVRIDAKTKSIHPYSLQEFKQLLSSVSQNITGSIEKYKQKISKKKAKTTYHYDYSAGRIEAISSLQKQENAYNLFKI